MASAVGSRAQRFAPDAVGRQALTLSLPRRAPHAVLDRIRHLARILEENPGLSSVELAERLNVGRRSMSLLLLRLEEHGHVVHQGRRWYPGPESVT